MVSRNILQRVILMILLISLIIVIGNPATAKTYRIAHVMTENDPYHWGVAEFVRLVEERTNNEVEFDIYPFMQLGGEQDITEGVAMGIIDAGLTTNAFSVNLAPELGVLDFPYLFKSKADAYAVLDSEIGKELMSKLEPANIKCLAFMENGYRNLNTVIPIKTPEDLKGEKLRTMITPIHLAAFNAAGANATPIAGPELYTSIQQGVVIGHENPFRSIYDYKYYEIAPYITRTEHFYTTTNLLINLDLWNSFSSDIQEIMQQAALEATAYQRQACIDLEEKVIKEMRDLGVTIIEDVDKEQWIEAMSSVYENPDFVEQYGEWFDRIQEFLDKREK